MKIKRIITAPKSPSLRGGSTLVRKGTEVCGQLSVGGDICVDGQLEGTFIVITGLLYIHSGGSVNGSISVGQLAIEPGGLLNGHCLMAVPEDGSPSPE